MISLQKELRFLVETHLRFIYDEQSYPDLDHAQLARKLIKIVELDEQCLKPVSTRKPVGRTRRARYYLRRQH